MSVIKQLGHVCIGANDVAESKRFYMEVLGLKNVFNFSKEGQPFGFYIDVGNHTYIEVFRQDVAAAMDRPLMKHLCLEVTDIDAFIAEVKSKNWAIGEKKMGVDNTWQVWLADPSGVPIEVQEYTDKSSQITGADCVANW